jgi:hypothetical protein
MDSVFLSSLILIIDYLFLLTDDLHDIIIKLE